MHCVLHYFQLCHSDISKMVQFVKNDENDPWIAISIFDFYFFCCPECDEKTKDKQKFVNHVSTYHSAVSDFRKTSLGVIQQIRRQNFVLF